MEPFSDEPAEGLRVPLPPAEAPKPDADGVITDELGGRYLVLDEESAHHVKTLRAWRERARALGVELWIE